MQAALVLGISWLIAGKHSAFNELSTAVPSAIVISCVTMGWMVVYLAVTSGRRNREKQLALRDAELRGLEAQINPHFLFNSLNSIRGLVVENPPLAQDLITRLANILRYNLHRDAGHTVPLDSELEAAGRLPRAGIRPLRGPAARSLRHRSRYAVHRRAADAAADAGRERH